MADTNPESDRQLEFLWASVRQLEDRITTVDNKGNILIGVALALSAVSGTFASKALEDSTRGEDIVIWLSTGLALVMAGYIVLVCLLLLNPRGATPERTGYEFPRPYVLWPRSKQPWTEGADSHIAAVLRMTEDQRIENLLAMQTTLIFLVDAKYRHYRHAIKATRVLVMVQFAGIAGSVIAIGL